MTFATEPKIREQLRKPFPEEQIGTLPKTDKRPALPFVGHAPVTERINQVVPDTTWTIDREFEFPHPDGNFWVRGTIVIGAISRVEYGNGRDPKDAIGNFLRRGAMRFGVALDLWGKEELSGLVEPVVDRGTATADGKADPDDSLAYGEGASDSGDGGVSAPSGDSAPVLTSQVRALLRAAEDLRWGDPDISAALQESYGITSLKQLTQEQARELIPEWMRLAKSIRLTDEQLQEIKTLATLADAKKVAERIFDFRVPNLHVLTVEEGTRLLFELRRLRVAS